MTGPTQGTGRRLAGRYPKRAGQRANPPKVNRAALTRSRSRTTSGVCAPMPAEGLMTSGMFNDWSVRIIARAIIETRCAPEDQPAALEALEGMSPAQAAARAPLPGQLAGKHARHLLPVHSRGPTW
jgi:hypothetical protein